MPAPFFTFPWRGKVAARRAAGWGESARSALRLPESPRIPPRVPTGRDPPPPGEGEVNAFPPRKHHQSRILLRFIRATYAAQKREAETVMRDGN
jgi:hypothetical protein